MPPPANCGARVEPWRARPVPFWRYGFLPPPRTSARVLALCVPWRAAASWATTTWWISGTFAWTSKISAGSSALPDFFPVASRMSTAVMSGPLRGGLDHDGAALGAGHRTDDEEDALLGVDGVDREVLGGLAGVAHATSHAQALEDARRRRGAADLAGLAVVAVRTGGGADAGEEALLGVDGGDREVLGGLAVVAHPTSHAQALEDARRRRGAADRAGLAVVAVRTVGGADAGEAETLHDTGGALALGRADELDDGPGLEGLRGELLADAVLGGVGGADLGEVAARRDARGVEARAQRLGQLARVDLAVGELDRAVAVGLRRLDLGDD